MPFDISRPFDIGNPTDSIVVDPLVPVTHPSSFLKTGVGAPPPLSGVNLKDGNTPTPQPTFNATPTTPPTPPTTPPTPPTPPTTPPTPHYQGNVRPQDTVQMFSRLNPTVQGQILAYMGFTPEQSQAFLATMAQHPELQRDSPEIVGQWNALFGNQIDLSKLGTSIFSNTVHPEDADHNYRNYGAISWDPNAGLVATPESGQFGEPNERGLRQLQTPFEIAAAVVAAAFGAPEFLAMLGPAAAEEAVGAFDLFGSVGLGDVFAGGGAEFGTDLALEAIPTLGEVGVDTLDTTLAESLTANPAAMADTLTPTIVDSIPTIPNGPPLNTMLDAPLIDAPLVPAPGGGVTPPGPNDFDISTTPPNILSPPMQPISSVDIPPPNIPTSTPGFGQGFLDTLTRDPLRTVGTGLTIAELLGGKAPGSGPPPKLPPASTTDPDGTLATSARDTLQHNGAPTPDQVSAINAVIDDQWRTGREKMLQAAANSGMGNENSMVVQDKLRSFRTQLETQRQTLMLKQADQNMLIALQELGLISKEQFQLASLELQQSQLSQQRAMSIMQSLGWLWQQGSTKKPASATSTNTDTPTDTTDTSVT